MPTSRELVAAIRQRDGVEAAVLLGRDGLLIDGQTEPSLDAEHLAAHVPSIVTAGDELATGAQRGTLRTAVLEYAEAVAIVSVLSDEALLLVIVRPDSDLGPLLFELRRNRDRIAALV